jgi:hypothetical protein
VREVALVVTTETVRGETIIAWGRYIARLAALARSQNLTRFEADVLSENSPMLAVFKRCGFPCDNGATAA